jgi:hypothetical protein
VEKGLVVAVEKGLAGKGLVVAVEKGLVEKVRGAEEETLSEDRG